MLGGAGRWVLQAPEVHRTVVTSPLHCRPALAVSFNGRTHKVQVQPGHEGAKAFETEIRKMLQLPEEQEFDVSVDCALRLGKADATSSLAASKAQRSVPLPAPD